MVNDFDNITYIGNPSTVSYKCTITERQNAIKFSVFSATFSGEPARFGS